MVCRWTEDEPITFPELILTQFTDASEHHQHYFTAEPRRSLAKPAESNFNGSLANLELISLEKCSQ